MDKKIIFFDIDGTLLNKENIVPESTKTALRKLKEEGHLRFVCTGRTKCMLSSVITELEFDGYVYGGGTDVEFGKQCLEYAELSSERIQEVTEVLNQYQAAFILEGKDNIYVEEFALQDERIFFSKFVKGLGEIAKVIVDDEHVHASKITMLLPEDMTEEAMAEFTETLSKWFNVIVHESGDGKAFTDGLVELMPLGYTKASGVQRTIEALQIPWENTIGVGDSNNDLEMLSYVHTAICMGNGTDRAKELAQLVTTDIDADGISNAMESLQLI